MEIDIQARRASAGEIPAALVLKNGYVLNVYTDEIIEADVAVSGGVIVGVGNYSGELELDCSGRYILPGFIDAHMHVESTLLTPLGLSKHVLPKGTTTLIADPHELVNVRGALALEYFLGACAQAPLNINVMLPSCVPATPFDTNGAGRFLARDMEPFVNSEGVLGLGEVMSFREVISGESSVLDKLALFSDRLIDGHAPCISNKDTQLYRLSGILTDHECSTFEEALDKLRAGMHILIREGSGAQNLEAIVSGMLEHELPFDCCSFCTDDKHISDIDTLGHVNHCVNRAISLGMHPVYAIKAATINTARRYGLHDVGAVSAGMRADIIVTDNLEKIEPEIVFKDGNAVSSSMFDAFEEFPVPEPLRHSVLFDSLTTKRIAVEAGDSNHVIGTVQGQLLTEHLVEHLPQREGIFQPNKLYNKLVTAERHGKNGNIAACALKGFGIERGAMATSCSHDSHNVVAVGDNDADIITATDRLRELQGGYVVVREGKVTAELSLPIGGLITDACGAEVSRRTSTVIAAARALGIPDGIDPLTNLSFMALPVMPSLRLLDTGLFDVDTYRLI